MTETSPPPGLYQLILLRHGQSEGNAQGYFQGQADFPLTDTGRAQAEALAGRWLSEGRRFDLAVSSPLLRARQTAEIIAQALGVSLELDPLWLEIDNGLLKGLKAEEARDRYPRPEFIHPYLPIGGTGESLWDLYLRAGQALASILARPPGSYLVVSHGGILNRVMYAVLGIAPQADFHGPRFRFQNAAYASLGYNPREHEWLVQAVNERSHWVDESGGNPHNPLDRV